MQSVDVLRLEVETDPDAGTLTNLIENPDGSQGAWGWVTPVFGTTLVSATTPHTPCLQYNPAASVANFFYTDPAPVTVGHVIGAGWVVQACNVAAGNGWYRAKIEFLNASSVLLSATTPTAYLQEDTNGERAYLPSATVPSGAVYARLRFDMYLDNAGANVNTTSALMTVHNAAMVSAATAGELSWVTRTNLVANPSFESNVTGWTGDSVSVARSTAQALTGTGSLAATKTGAAGNAFVSTATGTSGIPVTPNTSYYAAAWSRAATAGRSVYLFITWYNASGTRIGTSAGLVGTNSTSSWTGVNVGGMSPHHAAFARVGFQFADILQVGEVHYLDTVTFEKWVNGTGTYFDGNTASTANKGYAWTGTANNSTSNQSEYAPYSDGTWRDILGPAHEIRVVREDLNAGTLSATILSEDFDPATVDTLHPGRRVRLHALDAASDEFVPLFEGTLTKADVKYDLTRPDGRQARISVVAVDNVRTLANVSRAMGVGTIDELRYLMEGAGVPWSINGNSNQRATGTEVAQNQNASLLDQIAITRDSVLGYAWVNRGGVLVANDADEMPAGEAATIDESVYSDIDVSFNTDSLINDITVKWLRYSPGPGIKTEEVTYGPYRDQASIDTWGSHSAEFTIQGTGENAVTIEAYADSILAANGTPVVRINSVQIPIRSAADVSAAKALLDLYDLVRLQNADKGLEHLSRITGIEHSITTDGWLMHLSFAAPGVVAAPQATPSPGTQGTVTAVRGDVTTLNDVTIPAIVVDVTTAQTTADDAAVVAAQAQSDADALDVRLDTAETNVAANATAISNLSTATLPALQSELDATQVDVASNASNIATLTGTTIPALDTRLDGAEADVASAQGDIDTLNNTTLPALQTQVNGILPITTTDISDDAITTPKIAANAVTAAEIAANTITANEIAANAITAAEIAAGAVTAVKIAANTITAAEIAADAITASELAANAVTAGKIAAGTVTATELSAGAVTAGKIGAGAIVANDISSGAITTVKLAAGAVTANEIAAGAITAAKLDAAAITGKTITGGLFRTMGSGTRIEIDSADLNQIHFYSGSADETAAGLIETNSTIDSPGSNDSQATLALTAPGYGGVNKAKLKLYYTSPIGPGGNVNLADLSADEINLNATSVQVNGVDVVTETSSDVLTNKNLTSASNSFPTTLATRTGTETLTNKTLTSPTINTGTLSNATLTGTTTLAGEQIAAMRFGAASGTTNASGQLVVTHGLGVTPVAVLLGNAGFLVRVQSTTSTSFTAECRLPTTSAVAASVAVTFSWMAIA